MNVRNRTRILWAMAALVVAYALLNVVVFFVSGSFGTGWFLASLAVYGAVLVAAVLMLVLDKPDAERADEPRVAVQVVNVQDRERRDAPPAEDGEIVEVPPAPMVERGSTADVRRHEG